MFLKKKKKSMNETLIGIKMVGKQRVHSNRIKTEK